MRTLAEAGFRVAAMGLRGHGDNDATFTAHVDVAATDAHALVDELGGPAVLVGHPLGAGAAVWAAAERPDLVAGLVLVGPLVRQVLTNPMPACMFRNRDVRAVGAGGVERLPTFAAPRSQAGRLH